MNFGFDWNQRTTRLAVPVIIGQIIGGIFIALGNYEAATAFMGISGTAAGILGAAVRDPE